MNDTKRMQLIAVGFYPVAIRKILDLDKELQG